MSEAPSFPKQPGRLRRFFSKLGPGLVTGAADDDPSGVATYSIVGAQLGTSMLWTAVLTWPLMGCVQFMCARIGMVTGGGLASALVKKLPRSLLIVFTIALLMANTINVAADLAGMSDAAEMLTGLDSHVFVVLFGVGISYATIRFRYVQIARILKWLSLVLFAYVLTAFTIGPDWRTVLHDTFVPHGRRGTQGGPPWSPFSGRRSVRTSFSGSRVRRSRKKRQRAYGPCRPGRVRVLKHCTIASSM